MEWMRFRHAAGEGFGRLDGDEAVVHDGDLFAAPRPTGARLAVAGLEWLAPCRPATTAGWPMKANSPL